MTDCLGSSIEHEKDCCEVLEACFREWYSHAVRQNPSGTCEQQTRAVLSDWCTCHVVFAFGLLSALKMPLDKTAAAHLLLNRCTAERCLRLSTDALCHESNTESWVLQLHTSPWFWPVTLISSFEKLNFRDESYTPPQ